MNAYNNIIVLKHLDYCVYLIDKLSMILNTKIYTFIAYR